MIARIAARFRALRRLVQAAWYPVAYARFVNSERCYFSLENDPDGLWTARIGVKSMCRRATMRAAILAAHKEAETSPGWQWPTDFLRDRAARRRRNR